MLNLRLKTECRCEMAQRSQCNAVVGFKKICFPDKYNYIREIAVSWPLYLGFDSPCKYFWFSMYVLGVCFSMYVLRVWKSL